MLYRFVWRGLAVCVCVSLSVSLGAGCTNREGGSVVTVTVETTATEAETQAADELPPTTVEPEPPATADASLTRAEYRRTIRKGAAAIGFVLDRVAQARNYRALVNRTERAHEAALSIATNLSTVEPPDGMTATHERWVGALQAFAAALERTSDAVNSRSLCVAPAAVARISQVEAVNEVEAARRVLAEDGIRVPPFIPPPAALLDRSLPTGQVIVNRLSGGPGEWKIENGLVVDAVVAVTGSADPSRPLFSVYVQAGDRYTIEGLSDGIYRLFFTVGKDWDPQLRRFTQKCDFTAFDEPSEFVTTATQYTIWEASLQPVAGGTGRTSLIDPDDFPALQ
jgi:hypothetical protein